MARVEPSLLYLVKQVELAVRARLDELLRPHGLTTATYTALTVLERSTGQANADLARLSFVTPQAMADIVTALERRGLVERHADPDHGRRRLVALTSPGHAVLARVAPDVAALEERMVAALPPHDRATLRTSLDACRGALGHAGSDLRDKVPPTRERRRVESTHRVSPTTGTARQEIP